MKKLTAVFCILLLLCACRKENVHSGEGIYVALHKREKILPDSLLFESVAIISLQDSPYVLIQNIDKIIEHQGKYVILDQYAKQVLLYDKQGNHLNTIHRVGNGPGEYAGLRDIAIDYENNNIALLVYPQKLLFYNFSAEFVKEYSLGGNYKSLLIKDNYIYLEKSMYVNNIPSGFSLLCINQRTGVRDSVLTPLPEIAPHCNSDGLNLSGVQHTTFVRKFDNTIYRVHEEQVTVLYDIDFLNNNFPANQRDRQFSCDELNELCFGDEYNYSITDIKETDGYLFFKTNLAGLYVLDKKDNTLSFYQSVKNTECDSLLPNIDFVLPHYLPVQGDNDLIAFVYPSHIFSLYNSQMELNWQGKDGKPLPFKGIFDNLNEDSNPLLFIYSIKK